MPIRINLIAEAQAIEDLRRRDPVKRSLFVALSFVVMVLVWMSSLQVKIMADNVRLNNLETRMNSRTNEYAQVLNNKKTLLDVRDKLAALNRLSAYRFLQATLLDSLMHATTDGIQITRLRTEQAYDYQAEVKPVIERNHPIGGKPAQAVERIKLIVDAKDTSPNPGNEQITKFKETLAHTAYFDAQKMSTNNILLKNLSSPQFDADASRSYVLFNLECAYPEHAR